MTSWYDKKGKEVFFEDMTDKYLINVINYMQSHAVRRWKESKQYIHCTPQEYLLNFDAQYAAAQVEADKRRLFIGVGSMPDEAYRMQCVLPLPHGLDVTVALDDVLWAADEYGSRARWQPGHMPRSYYTRHDTKGNKAGDEVDTDIGIGVLRLFDSCDGRWQVEHENGRIGWYYVEEE